MHHYLYLLLIFDMSLHAICKSKVLIGCLRNYYSVIKKLLFQPVCVCDLKIKKWLFKNWIEDQDTPTLPSWKMVQLWKILFRIAKSKGNGKFVLRNPVSLSVVEVKCSRLRSPQKDRQSFKTRSELKQTSQVVISNHFPLPLLVIANDKLSTSTLDRIRNDITKISVTGRGRKRRKG